MTKKDINMRAIQQWTAKGPTHRNTEDQNTLITAVENQPITEEHNSLLGDA